MGIGASARVVDSTGPQNVGFAAASVAPLVFLRPPHQNPHQKMGVPGGSPRRSGEVVAAWVVLSEDLAPGEVGRADLRGTE